MLNCLRQNCSLWMRQLPYPSQLWSNFLDHIWSFCLPLFMDMKALEGVCLLNLFPLWSSKIRCSTLKTIEQREKLCQVDLWKKLRWTNQSDMEIMTLSRNGSQTCFVLMRLRPWLSFHKDSHILINAIFTTWTETLYFLTILPLRVFWTKSWIFSCLLITKTHRMISNCSQTPQLIKCSAS